MSKELVRELREALTEQTLHYAEHHKGRDNIEQRNALATIKILTKSLDSVTKSEETGIMEYSGDGSGCVGIVIVGILVFGAVLIFG